MAEIVEFREEQVLLQYEHMRAIRLFDDSEIREIIKIRNDFNYKIQRPTKSIKDYCEYIKYERNLISVINIKRKALNNLRKKPNIEQFISARIKYLYKQAIDRFPEEIRIWDHYIKFCQSFKFNDGSLILDKMIQLHGDKPEVWLRAAMWEYKVTYNMERVKHFMLGGIQRHPENCELYTNLFDIELKEAAKMSTDIESSNSNKQISKQSLGLERAEIIYKNTLKKIHSIDFHIKMLEIAQEHEFAKSLQDKIVKNMTMYFPREELMWHTLAQRELKGFHFNDASGNDSSSYPASRSGKRIELCVKVYETAVKELKTQKMWFFYINSMQELNKDLTKNKALKEKCLQNAMKGAHEANCMTEMHYLQYIQVLATDIAKTGDAIIEVMQKATTLHPSSVQLWELWMRFHIQNNEEDKVDEVFFKAIERFPNESYPLWTLLLNYYKTRPDIPFRVNEIYKQAVKQPPAISYKFMPLYIEYIALTKNIIKAREIYRELTPYGSQCLELHQKMAQLESMQLNPDINAWRNCHETLTTLFGSTHTNIWIDYIKFERDYGVAKNMSTIYERAKATLKPDLVDDFITAHSCLIHGILSF